VVATSGTALTRDHLKILSRYSAEIIFAFDEDEAGQKAAISAGQLALQMALEAKLTIIDGYKDVGELVSADKKKWPQIIDRALSPVEWLVAKATQNSNEITIQVKKKLTQSALLFISSMQDEIEKAHYLSYLAKVVQVPEIAVERALTKHKNQLPEVPKVAPPERNIEGEFLSFLINFPAIVNGLTLEDEIKFKKNEFSQIYKQVVSCYTSKGSIEKCLTVLKKNLPREIREELDALAIAWDVKVTEARDEAFRDFLAIKNKLETYKKEAIKDNFAQMIAEAEAKGDLEEVKHLMQQLQKSLKK
jgi:DNA primase